MRRNAKVIALAVAGAVVIVLIALRVRRRREGHKDSSRSGKKCVANKPLPDSNCSKWKCSKDPNVSTLYSWQCAGKNSSSEHTCNKVARPDHDQNCSQWTCGKDSSGKEDWICGKGKNAGKSYGDVVKNALTSALSPLASKQPPSTSGGDMWNCISKQGNNVGTTRGSNQTSATFACNKFNPMCAFGGCTATKQGASPNTIATAPATQPPRTWNTNTTTWQCYKNGTAVGPVTINWGHKPGDAGWACSQQISACAGGWQVCSVKQEKSKTTWTASSPAPAPASPSPAPAPATKGWTCRTSDGFAAGGLTTDANTSASDAANQCNVRYALCFGGLGCTAS